MNTDEIVCSQSQAERLKHLGVVQKSEFYYIKATGSSGGDNVYHKTYGSTNKITIEQPERAFSRFTSAELGFLLPQTISFNKTQKASLYIVKFNIWSIVYKRHSSHNDATPIIESYNEAIARAEMLLHLLENNLVALNEVNQILELKS